MSYSLSEKIQALEDQIGRLDILSDLLVETDTEASDNANKTAKILSNISEDYKIKYKNTYDKEWSDE